MTEKRVEFETVNYIDHPLSAKKLARLLNQAGVRPEDALRRNEDSYHKYVVGKDLTAAQLVELMAAHPELIQRPIVVKGQKAVLARPLEKMTELGIE